MSDDEQVSDDEVESGEEGGTFVVQLQVVGPVISSSQWETPLNERTVNDHIRTCFHDLEDSGNGVFALKALRLAMEYGQPIPDWLNQWLLPRLAGYLDDPGRADTLDKAMSVAGNKGRSKRLLAAQFRARGLLYRKAFRLQHSFYKNPAEERVFFGNAEVLDLVRTSENLVDEDIGTWRVVRDGYAEARRGFRSQRTPFGLMGNRFSDDEPGIRAAIAYAASFENHGLLPGTAKKLERLLTFLHARAASLGISR